MGCASSKDLDEATRARERGDNPGAIKKYKEAIDKQEQACTPCGGPSLIRLYYGLGTTYQDQAQYKDALVAYSSALEKQKASLGPEDPSLGNTYYCMATLHHAQGDLPEAEKNYEQAKKLWEKMKVQSAKQMASLHSAMASMYESQAKFELAQESYRKGKKFWEALLDQPQGPEKKPLKDDKANPELVAIYLSMAGAFNSIGETDQALSNFRKAEQVLNATTTLAGDHPLRGQMYEGMAEAYNAQGDAAKALELYLKALEILQDQRHGGNNHPCVGKAYDGMAGAYFAQNKTEKAIETYKKAEAVWTASPGPKSRNLGYTYDAMASVYLHRGEFEKAINYWKQAFEILQLKENLGPSHPDLSGIHYGLATASKELAEFEDALDYYDKALSMKIETLGKQTIKGQQDGTKLGPQIGNVFYGQASIYSAQGKMDQAKEKYKAALDFWKKAMPAGERELTPAEKKQLGATYESMAGAEVALDNQGQAEEYYKKADKLITEESSNKGLIYLGMATLYAEQGKKKEAEEYHKKAEEIWKKQLRDGHHHMGNTNHSLANLKDDKNEALKLYQEALKIQEAELGKKHPCVAGTLYGMASAKKELADTKISKETMKKEDKEKLEKLDKDKKWAELKKAKEALDTWNTQAIADYTRAMQIQEEKLGPKHSHLAATYFGLAVVYDTQQNMSGLYSPKERSEQRQKAQDFFAKAKEIYPEGDKQHQYAQKRIDSIEKEKVQEDVQRRELAFNNQGKPMGDAKDGKLYPKLDQAGEAKEAAEIANGYKKLHELMWKTRTTTVKPPKGKDGDKQNLKALEYFEKAAKLQDAKAVGDTYFSMGEVYEAQSKMLLVWDEAERQQQKSKAKSCYGKVPDTHPKAAEAKNRAKQS